MDTNSAIQGEIKQVQSTRWGHTCQLAKRLQASETPFSEAQRNNFSLPHAGPWNPRLLHARIMAFALVVLCLGHGSLSLGTQASAGPNSPSSFSRQLGRCHPAKGRSLSM